MCLQRLHKFVVRIFISHLKINLKQYANIFVTGTSSTIDFLAPVTIQLLNRLLVWLIMSTLSNGRFTEKNLCKIFGIQEALLLEYLDLIFY